MVTQWQRWAAAAVVAAAGLVVGACGGGSDNDEASPTDTKASGTEAPAGATIEVEGKEFSYSPATLTLKAGQPTKIVLKNTGVIEHDITVPDTGFKLTVPGSNNGDKTLTLDKPGTYKMFCSVAGHETAGMKGEIKVE